MNNQRTLTKEKLLSIFPGKKSLLVDDIVYQKSLDFINKNDFPTKDNEIWRHSDLRQLYKHNYEEAKFVTVSEDFISNFSILNLNSEKIVFINGFYSEKNSNLSNKEDIIICSAKDAKSNHSEIFDKYFESTEIHKDNIFAALNTAFAENGVFIYIPENYISENPIHVLFFVDGNGRKVINQNRNLIIAGKNSQAKVICSYHSLTRNYTLTNSVSEIFLSKDAQLNYNLFQGEGNDAFQINNTRVIQHANSVFTSNNSTHCGALVKNNLTVDLAGEYSEANLHGLCLPDKEQHFDHYVNVRHLKPNCTSNQLYKGIIDNKAKAIFMGRVFVAKGAQKTDANQSNRNLLLTDYARAHSKPQLEIYADDVSCSHGSTTGQLDKEALFYLRTRGIPEKRAKTLLMKAFAKEVMDKITIKPYKDFVSFLVNKRLKGEEITGLCSVKICPTC